MDIYQDLRRMLGGSKVSRDPFILSLHTRDAAYLRGEADAVVYPETIEDVRRVVNYCYETGTPLYPQGGSSELTGSSIPQGGVVMSMIRMRRVLESSPGDGYIYVEPGIRLVEVNMELAGSGMFFPIDPASIKTATVGGAVSTGAGGLRGFKYGLMRDWVLGLDLVLPDEEASLLRLSYKTLKSREGYDLVRLIVGSEGTLAIVVGVVLRLAPLQGDLATIAALYDSLDRLVETVIRLRSSGLDLSILEFVDRNTVAKVRSYGRRAPEGDGDMLLVGLSGEAEKAMEIIRMGGGEIVAHADSMAEAEEMGIYEVRRGFYPVLIDEAVEKTGGDPVIYIEDVSVPPSRLPETLPRIVRLLEEEGISYGLAGHVGDGNIHPTMWASHEDMERLYRVGERIMDIALEYDGVVSSEHGIGIVKKRALMRSLRRRGPKALDIMRGIKRLFDPRNILNPGKVV